MENQKQLNQIEHSDTKAKFHSYHQINIKLEKLTPFYMGEHEGMPALCYEVSDFKVDVFKSVKLDDEEEMVGDALDWEELAICYLNITAPLLKDEIEVGSDGDDESFWALSDNLTALEEFAYGFRKMCDDEVKMKQLLAHAYDHPETSKEDLAREFYGKVMFESKPLNENGFTVTLFRKGIGIKKAAKFYMYGFEDFKIVKYNKLKGRLVLKGFFRKFRLNADVNDVQEIYNRLNPMLDRGNDNGEESLKEPAEKNRIRKLIWLGIGLIAMGYGIYGLFEESQIRSQAVETMATIEEIERSEDDSFTVVSFVLDNEPRLVRSSNIRPEDEWNVGDEIIIYVVPGERLRLRTQTRMSAPMIPQIIAIASGAILVVVAGGMLLGVKSKAIESFYSILKDM